MKKPLTRKEWFWRGATGAIVIFNIFFVYFASSALSFFTTPHTFSEDPIMCFERPTEPVGMCDIETISHITTSTPIGDFIPVANQVFVSTTALILSPAFNKTGETFLIGFQGEAIYGWNPKSNSVGCYDKIPTDTFQLAPASFIQGFGESYNVAFSMCLPAQGQYPALMVVHNGTQTILLTEAQGFPELTAGPQGIVQNFNFNFVIIFFTLVLVILEVIQSLQLLLDIYPKAFPYRIEYPSDRPDYRNSQTKLKDWIIHWLSRRERNDE